MTGSYHPSRFYEQAATPVMRRRRVWPWFLAGFLALAVGSATAVWLGFTHIRDRLPTSIQVTDEGARITTPQGEEIIIPADGDKSGEMRTVTSQRVPINEGDEFSLSNISGRIMISTWDKGEAEIKMIKHGVDIGNGQKVNLQVSRSGSNVNVKAETADGAPASVDYDVKLPAGVHLSSIDTISGPIAISGATGSIHAKSASGEIHIDVETGNVSAKTASGDVTVILDNVPAGREIDLGSASGNVQLKIKEGFNAEIDLKTLSGKLDVDSSLGLAIDQGVVGRRARGKLGDGASAIHIKTVSGNISVGQ